MCCKSERRQKALLSGSVIFAASFSVPPCTLVVASLATSGDLATPVRGNGNVRTVKKQYSLWIVGELLWEGVERSRLGCVWVEAGCRLPRTIRTTKFHPALAERPVVASRDARSLLVSLRRAAVNRAPCWSWRRAGWSWRWGVWRDTQDHRAQVAKYPRYSIDQLDSRTLHCNQSGCLS